MARKQMIKAGWKPGLLLLGFLWCVGCEEKENAGIEVKTAEKSLPHGEHAHGGGTAHEEVHEGHDHGGVPCGCGSVVKEGIASYLETALVAEQEQGKVSEK